jgi:hypothetical protein
VATVGTSGKWRKIFWGRIEENMIHGIVGDESTIDQMSQDMPTSRHGSADGARVAVLLLVTLMLGPIVLTIVASRTINQRNQPSDQELLGNFLAHEREFSELVEMLGADCRSLSPGARESIDFAGLSAVVMSAARMELYRRLLQQISIADLRYFPGSGELALLPGAARTNIEGSSKTYAYREGGQPQSVVAHHHYNWRGPGVYFLTGDRQIKGYWFIHYDTAISVEFSPY